MIERFNTVETEVKNWRNFTLNSEIYDLSHLNAHSVEYLDNRDTNNLITYKFIVTYGLHCFTKESEDITEEESQLLMYKGRSPDPLIWRDMTYQSSYLKLSRHLVRMQP